MAETLNETQNANKALQEIQQRYPILGDATVEGSGVTYDDVTTNTVRFTFDLDWFKGKDVPLSIKMLWADELQSMLSPGLYFQNADPAGSFIIKDAWFMTYPDEGGVMSLRHDNLEKAVAFIQQNPHCYANAEISILLRKPGR